MVEKSAFFRDNTRSATISRRSKRTAPSCWPSRREGEFLILMIRGKKGKRLDFLQRRFGGPALGFFRGRIGGKEGEFLSSVNLREGPRLANRSKRERGEELDLFSPSKAGGKRLYFTKKDG